MSLNSIPLPVHAMQPALASGVSNRVTRNCHSWREPLLPLVFCKLFCRCIVFFLSLLSNFVEISVNN